MLSDDAQPVTPVSVARPSSTAATTLRRRRMAFAAGFRESPVVMPASPLSAFRPSLRPAKHSGCV
jgi:hypothetical protein